ncbi:DUF5995 family protein [Mycolicibacterium septicum]|uniref:DUF5995 family protein n=1 Tax=Mycolicibacterium septicum TaxID=98668 RepID=UPI0023E2E637|nr:DUF5995 family protein [Mycolicibacterium septicum]MDF3338377.1 DUF5995 family protein [Mycolicibacterium septicum]
MASHPTPLPPIPPVTSIAEVVSAIDTVTDWAVENSSRLGYFAALYKRITIAVGVAVEDGAFEDGPRMDRLDAAFAQRYFDALNGYFHPDRYSKPTRSWRATFQWADKPEPILVQHMLAGVTAHIVLDLGIAVQGLVGPGQLPSLHKDFDTINAVLASQIGGVVNDINELSPALADIYAVLQQHQIFVLNEAIRSLRDSAWRFATVLALEPGFARPATIWARDLQVSQQAQAAFDPPSLVGAFDLAIKEIAARESRDVAHNVQVLDEIAATPAPIQTAL